MRALAGPMFLLVVIGGFGLQRALSKPDTPPRDFMDLEFAGADKDHTGSCYSLSTVLVATTAFLDVTRTWKLNEDESWTLSLESVQQGYGGPMHMYQHFTFKEQDGLIRLTAVDAHKGANKDVNANIDSLLEGPHQRRSTPVDRCMVPGATGYQFKQK